MFIYFQELFSEMGNIASFVTLAVTILGAASLMLANAARYFQAKKYGIPIKAVHQANIADSADIWVAFITTLGLGFFVPMLLLNADLSGFFLFGIAFAAFYLAVLSTKVFSLKINTSGKIDLALIFFALITFGATFAYMYFHNLHYNIVIDETDASGSGFFRNALAISGFSLYTIVVGYMFYVKIANRLFGLGICVTTEIDDELYLVAMRHNQYQWVLMPAEICCDRDKVISRRMSIEYNHVKFTRGLWTVKDMADLPKPLTTRYGFHAVDKDEVKLKKVPKIEEKVEKSPE